jgi:preprotein translocase subunit Sss1
MSERPSFFEEFKIIVVSYLESKVLLFKISAYEKIAKVTAVLFSSILVAFIGFFMFLFFSISLGFYLGELLQSNAIGFLIVGGIYFIIFLIVILFRKKLFEKYITDKVIEQLFEKEEND